MNDCLLWKDQPKTDANNDFEMLVEMLVERVRTMFYQNVTECYRMPQNLVAALRLSCGFNPLGSHLVPARQVSFPCNNSISPSL